MDEPTKICSKCPEGQNVKPVSQFGKHKRGKDGLRSTCKACDVKTTQARYTYHPRKVCRIIDGKKECTGCHEVKPIEDFPKDPTKNGGIGTRCNACKALKTAEWLERPGNAERQKKKLAENYQSKKTERDAKNKAYRDAHPELRAEWSRRKEVKRKASPELQAYHRQKTKEWEQAHPENVRQRANRRNSRKKDLPQIDVVDLDVLYKRDKATCSICHKHVKRAEASQDHIIPITKPGSEESYRNSALAHIDCNRRKNNRIVTQQMNLF